MIRLRHRDDRHFLTVSDIHNGALRFLDSPKVLSKLMLTWVPKGCGKRHTDIGSYCFAKRTGSSFSIRVDPSTLITHPMLVGTIHGALNLLANSPDSSITTALGTITRVLAADKSYALDRATILYAEVNRRLRVMLRERIIARSSAVNQERNVIEILCFGFDTPCESLIAGVRKLRQKTETSDDRLVMTLAAGREIAKAAADHFLEATRVLINNEPLPKAISIAGERFLLTGNTSNRSRSNRNIPLGKDGVPPKDSLYDTNFKLKKQHSPNYVPGRDVEGIREQRRQYGAARYERLCLAEANSSAHSFARLKLAGDAILSFLVLTYFDTGANVSSLQGRVVNGEQVGAVQVKELTGKRKHGALRRVSGSSNYLLETVKKRAGNKDVGILFSTTWVKQFLPVYLRLREYIENSGLKLTPNLLFYIVGLRYKKLTLDSNPELGIRLKGNRGHLLHNFLSMHGLRSVTASDIRNFKTAEITEKSSTRISAALMGHTEQTSRKHYNRISEAEAQREIAAALNTITSIAILPATSPDKSDTTSRISSGGACIKPDDAPPVSLRDSELGLFAPDCKTRSGCWMCKHFAVHADKEDLWKMKSYLYVLDELRQCADDPQGVNMVHKPIVSRISGLCARLLDTTPELTDEAIKVDEMVSAGHLHPVYRSMLATYELAGLI